MKNGGIYFNSAAVCNYDFLERQNFYDQERKEKLM